MDNAKVQSSMDKMKVKIVVRSAIILAAVSFAISVYAFISALPGNNLKDPTKFALIIFPLAAGGLLVFAAGIYWRTHKNVGIYILIGTLWAATLGQAFLISGIGVWLGLSAIILTATITTQTLPQKWINRFIIISIGIAAGTVLVDLFIPLPRISGGQQLQIFITGVMGIAIVLHILLMARQFADYSLRVKLIISYIFLSLIVILILGVSYSLVTQNALTKSTNTSLQIAAQQTANNIDGFYRSLLSSLKSEADSSQIRTYLALSIRTGTILEFNTTQLLHNLQQTTSALGYSVLSISGTVLIDTSGYNSTEIGFDVIPTNTYTTALSASGYYLSPVIYPDKYDPYFFAMAPINSDEGELAGILMARYPASILQDLVARTNNLIGPDSYALLWDDNKICLANGLSPTENYKSASLIDGVKIASLQSAGRLPKLPAGDLSIQNDSMSKGIEQIITGKPFFTALEDKTPGSGNTGGRKMVAAATKTTYQPWVVTFVQAQSTALAPITRLTRITVVMASILVLAMCLMGIFVAQMFTQPIVRLTKTAEQITGGDLNAQAFIGSQDEIGSLASAFNLMTAELRQTLAGLESRVLDRTAELEQVSKQMEKRATQLQTVAQVAHAISAFKDPDLLLHQITLLISERFGFYHVGVFLIDRSSENAVLRAANSEGGQRMLERGHRLQIGGNNIVGHVSKYGQARVALDVGKDAVYFDNPDLPLTRSEISLPLHSGETIMGVLDVQSEQPSAFVDEDIALLGTLADQVSIAIENARLFNDINQSMNELQALQRHYLQQEWQHMSADQFSGYQYSYGKITPLPKGQPAQISEKGESITSRLKIPISLRGQEIGVFNLEEIGGERQWSEDEIALVKTIADQVGLALENARLLEATQHRAARDRMVADITNKMRRAVDMDTLIQTAVREITSAINVPEAFVQLGVHPETPDQIQSEPPARQNTNDTATDKEAVK